MKLSPAFTTLLHIVWSGLFGLIIAGGTAVIQYNSTNGINFAQDGIIFTTVVLTGLGSALIAIWNNVQKSPALPVAEAEIESTLAAKADQLAQSAHARIDDIVAWLASQQYHAVASTPIQASQNAASTSTLKPTRLQPLDTPVVAQTPNIAPVGAVPVTTIPGMPVVQG